MTEFSQSDGEAILRQVQNLMPEGVDCVIIFIARTPSPEPLPPTSAHLRLITLATVSPRRALIALADVTKRLLTGEAAAYKLGSLQ